MYVGVTRAENRLYLTHAFRRARYGNYEPSLPSRILSEIPTKLTEGIRIQNEANAVSGAYQGQKIRKESDEYRPDANAIGNEVMKDVDTSTLKSLEK